MKRLLAMSLLCMIHNTFATPTGTVLFTAKKVTATKGSVERVLSRGSALETGDLIKTSGDALAKIRYANGTLVSIGSNSNYTILAYSPEQSDVQIKAELSKGSIESETEEGAKRQALTTPVVALAITGTHFKTYVSGKNTNVQLIAGAVTVGDTSLQPGQSVLATPDGVNFAPFPAVGNINMTPEMQTASVDVEVSGTSSSADSSSTKSTTSANVATSNATATTFVSSAIVTTANASTDTSVNAGLADVATFSMSCNPANSTP